MKILTGRYIGDGIPHLLELPGKKIFFQVFRANATTPGLVTKTNQDPDGEHRLQDNTGAITFFETGLEFTDGGVMIADGDPWLNLLDEEYRWFAILEGGP